MSKSILDGVLVEEYERNERITLEYQERLAMLPKGYLSKKRISGKVYYYLQYREDGKVVSQYIPAERVEGLQKQIADRRKCEQILKDVEKDQKKIRKAIGSLLEVDG